MTRRRNNPPAPGQYCDATRTRFPDPCRDPAVWLVFYVDEKTGETVNKSACGGHLNKLCADLTAHASFSREMFRVLPWEAVLAEHKRKHPEAWAAI